MSFVRTATRCLQKLGSSNLFLEFAKEIYLREDWNVGRTKNLEDQYEFYVFFPEADGHLSSCIGRTYNKHIILPK
jgi:hypothetical protein